jgi:hypothetical protein
MIIHRIYIQYLIFKRGNIVDPVAEGKILFLGEDINTPELFRFEVEL